MTVWFLIRSLEIGGAQRQLVDLALGLHGRGHRVAVFALRPDRAFAPPLEEAGIRVRLLTRPSPLRQARFLLRFLLESRRAGVDIVHSYLPGQNVLTALLRPFLSAQVVWGVRVAAVTMVAYNWRGRSAYAAERLLARTVPLIIVNSSAGRQLIREWGYPTSRVHVVNNGVDLDAFRPDAAAGQTLRREWTGDADAGVVVVGVVARLDPIKGHEEFLEAVALLKSQGARFRFVCVGDGPSAAYVQHLRRRADELGVTDLVTWAGRRTDMPSVYNAMDIVCSASHYEALPNALLEAMACGVPCVTTDIGDSAEVVGLTGAVVPRGDADALAAGIATLGERIRVEGAALKAATRARAEGFDRGRMVERTEHLLDGVVNASQ